MSGSLFVLEASHLKSHQISTSSSQNDTAEEALKRPSTVQNTKCRSFLHCCSCGLLSRIMYWWKQRPCQLVELTGLMMPSLHHTSVDFTLFISLHFSLLSSTLLYNQLPHLTYYKLSLIQVRLYFAQLSISYAL